METLEDVFLELCRKQATHSRPSTDVSIPLIDDYTNEDQKRTRGQNMKQGTVSWEDAEEQPDESAPLLLKEKEKRMKKKRYWSGAHIPRARNVSTIIWKNVTRLR